MFLNEGINADSKRKIEEFLAILCNMHDVANFFCHLCHKNDHLGNAHREYFISVIKWKIIRWKSMW